MHKHYVLLQVDISSKAQILIELSLYKNMSIAFVWLIPELSFTQAIGRYDHLETINAIREQQMELPSDFAPLHYILAIKLMKIPELR
ncbi:hypothetical protein SAMN04515695_0454 [Pseudovibrio sp. Tun.PSC04-5.I4]|nr:hypothetical protein SAMN04515695_0454 [Pseudovibrio sp. Tun.PSC04-5.I4]